MEVTQENREVAIHTLLGDDVLVLRSMTMQEELGRLFSIHTELFSLKENIKFEDLLGTNVSIRLNLPGDEKRFFNGHITQIAQTGNQGAYAVYEATIHPWLWFLTRTADCRIFQNQTVPDIIKAVFRDLGYTDFQEKLSNTYPTWEYCVQYRETDFNFVSRLMEQEGIYYYFQHQEGKHELVLSDNYSSHQPLPGVGKIPFYPPDEAAVQKEEACTHWYLSKQVMPGKYVLNDFDFKRPRANLQVNASVTREHAVADYEVYDYPGEYDKVDAGDTYVQTRIQELHAGYEQAHGQGNVRAMQAGGLFTLAEHPRDDQNREYLLTTVRHNINSDIFEGNATPASQELYSSSFTAIDSKTPFRPARTTALPQIRGPQTAIVVGPAGEEIYTDEHGRVKLQFHWDRYGKSDENSSCWVRVSQVHAGKGFGGIDVPRIGEEVIVEFLEGDPSRPIITGRVYNGNNTPPNGLPGAKMVSGLKSNSTPGGGGNNAIMLDDTKGKEGLNIHAQYNMDTVVENDQTNTINNNRTSTIAVDDTESVGSNQKISIGSDQSTSVGANQKVNVGANQTEEIGANQKLTVGASQDISIGANQTLVVKAIQDNDIGSSRKTTVGAGDELTVTGEQKISVSGPIEIESNAKITLKVGGSMIEISAGGIVIQSAAQITVQGSLVKLN